MAPRNKPDEISHAKRPRRHADQDGPARVVEACLELPRDVAGIAFLRAQVLPVSAPHQVVELFGAHATLRSAAARIGRQAPEGSGPQRRGLIECQSVTVETGQHVHVRIRIVPVQKELGGAVGRRTGIDAVPVLFGEMRHQQTDLHQGVGRQRQRGRHGKQASTDGSHALIVAANRHVQRQEQNCQRRGSDEREQNAVAYEAVIDTLYDQQGSHSDGYYRRPSGNLSPAMRRAKETPGVPSRASGCQATPSEVWSRTTAADSFY